MCTVTFIPTGDRIFITSNRDEQTLRPVALAPEGYEKTTGRIFFPKDGQAGGTWIALHENGHAMVLLNGAFERHLPDPPYRKSRGLIFLDIFDSENPVQVFAEIDLGNIEPFTLVLWVERALWELRWDGLQRYVTPKPADVPQIWSSATLYDPEAIEKRKTWFYTWLREQPEFTIETIKAFHEFGGEGNQAIDLMMSRYGGMLRTVSITAIELAPQAFTLLYQDNLSGKVSRNDQANSARKATVS